MNGMDNADMYVDIIDDDDFVPLHGMRIVIGFGGNGEEQFYFKMDGDSRSYVSMIGTVQAIASIVTQNCVHEGLRERDT